MKNVVTILSSASVLAASACLWGPQDSASSLEPHAPASTAATAGGGERDARPRAAILSPSNVVSNVGTTLRLRATVSCRLAGPCSKDPKATRALIASKIRLRDSAGRLVPMAAEDEPTLPASSKGRRDAPLPLPQYSATFVAASTLTPNESYTIELESDGEAVLAFAHASNAELREGIAATSAKHAVHRAQASAGSEPLPTRIERTNDSSKPLRSLRVVFSEPVALATLAQGGLKIFQANGAELESCAWDAISNSCASNQSPRISDIVDFVFTRAVEPSVLDTLSIELSTTVSGDGNSVAEVAARRKLPVHRRNGDQRVSLRAKKSDWEPCAGSSDLHCVHQLAVQ